MDKYLKDFFSSGLKIYLFTEKDVDNYLKVLSKSVKLEKKQLLSLKKQIMKKLREEKRSLKIIVKKEMQKLVIENSKLKERVRKIERYLDEYAPKSS